MAELTNTYNITIEDLTAYCDFNTLYQLSADNYCSVGLTTLTDAQIELVDILMQDVINQIENMFRNNYELPFASPLDKSLKGIICRLTVVALFKRRHAAPDYVIKYEIDEKEKLQKILIGEWEIFNLTRREKISSTRR